MKQLRLPKRLVVDGKSWKFFLEGEAPTRYRRKRSMLQRGMKGLAMRPELVALISNELTAEDRSVTILHEILHALLGSLAPWLSDADEEKLCEALDEELLSVLRQLEWESR